MNEPVMVEVERRELVRLREIEASLANVVSGWSLGAGPIDRVVAVRSLEEVLGRRHGRPAQDSTPTPVPRILTCPDPRCGARHVDKGEFATKSHHTHACQACGLTWRPAVVPTVGVQFLPGFKDEA